MKYFKFICTLFTFLSVFIYLSSPVFSSEITAAEVLKIAEGMA